MINHFQNVVFLKIDSPNAECKLRSSLGFYSPATIITFINDPSNCKRYILLWATIFSEKTVKPSVQVPVQMQKKLEGKVSSKQI